MIKTDDYGMDNSWTLDQISTGEPIANGGDYESNQEYTVDVPLPENDDYLFTMRDKNGNGMCCQEGEGSYLMRRPRDSSRRSFSRQGKSVVLCATVATLLGSSTPYSNLHLSGIAYYPHWI